MSATLRSAVAALVIVAGAVVFAVFGLASPSRARHTAPALPASALQGRPVTLTDLHGRPAFVVFWASWCEPCVHEAPALAAFARSLHGRASLVGVDYSDPLRSSARSFLARFGWTFPILLDPEGSAGAAYAINGLPTTVVLASDGTIERRLTGPQTAASLDGALSRALGATSS